MLNVCCVAGAQMCKPSLTCVGIDVPQGPGQERSNHKRCERNAHHRQCVQAMENLWKRGERHTLYVSQSHTPQFYSLASEIRDYNYIKLDILLLVNFLTKKKMERLGF